MTAAVNFRPLGKDGTTAAIAAHFEDANALARARATLAPEPGDAVSRHGKPHGVASISSHEVHPRARSRTVFRRSGSTIASRVSRASGLGGPKRMVPSSST